MNVKTVRIAAVVLLTAILIGIWMLWLRVEPDLRPDDVTLKGKLLPVSNLSAAKPKNGEAWAAEVQVKRSGGTAEAASGTDMIYLYIPGLTGGSYEIAGDSRPELLRKEMSPAMYRLAAAMLKQIGLSIDETGLHEPGYSYTGKEPAYTARIYLKAQESPASGQDALSYAIYIHQEHKWGKNVSWTKAVKLEK